MLIDIAVPTYNCSPWINEFFESVLRQDVANWRLIVRDDRSADATVAKLKDWQSRLGDRMQILDSDRNLGMVGNYDAVLAASSAQWVMLADPDDVWLPGKIARSLRAMERAESELGPSMPIVAFSDAIVIDSHSHRIAPSYWQWSRMNPCSVRLPRMIVESPLLTSGLMVNRAALNLALPMSRVASCPDWWIGLVAAAFGKIVRLDGPSFLYRRHPSNDSLDPLTRRPLSLATEARKRTVRLIRQWAPQAEAFEKRFSVRLSARDRAAFSAASALLERGPLSRRLEVARHGLWFSCPIKNVGLLALM